VADLVKGFTDIGNLAESGKPSASHLTDFDVPLYNVWRPRREKRRPPRWKPK
jgi:hypothetical protein